MAITDQEVDALVEEEAQREHDRARKTHKTTAPQKYASKIETFEVALSLVFWGIVASSALPSGFLAGVLMGGYGNSFDGFGFLIGLAIGGFVGYVLASFVTGIAYVLLSINQRLGVTMGIDDKNSLPRTKDESQ